MKIFGRTSRTVAALGAVVMLAACTPRGGIPLANPTAGATTADGSVVEGDSASGGSNKGRTGGNAVRKNQAGGKDIGDSGGTAGSSQLSSTIPTERSAQFKNPKTANVCAGRVIKTGSKVQFPWAPQCVPTFAGDNGGETYRGVYRDRIRVAVYITRDPVVVSGVRAAGGCGEVSCWKDYVTAYIDWFEKYYQMYGRRIEPIFIEGSGSEANETAARDDARRIASIDPPVMAALGGPNQASTVYAEELTSKGIMCFCTFSLPEEFYAKYYPMVWGPLMSSTQAYIHRAEYIGKRLARKPARHAGDPTLRAQKRSFGMVYFDNTRGDYRAGVQFFQKQLARYGVKLKKIIPYTNIDGCQTDATNIVNQLQIAGVTSVLANTDPFCPIHLTRAANLQNAKWEWIVTGSGLTDTNNFARLYNQEQWSRAFGISMQQPDVKNEAEYWHKMYKEVRPSGDPKEEAPAALSPFILFYTGVHLAGPNLTPKSFAAAMDRAITTGGTVTLPQRSYGRKTVTGVSFWDTTSYDDMVELWWDPDQQDANGRQGAYWYVSGGKRYEWGGWPSTAPRVFTKKGAVYGYENPPDQ
ncbi:MAG TPA: hypothetical protein VG929_04665 [Actinomycetota bacterium]|nr:hypothetical protein [Actinomycetota bacterium]